MAAPRFVDDGKIRPETDTIMSPTNVTRTTGPAWCAEDDHILDASLPWRPDFAHLH